jgi:simple sugar transport system ATP-binding protein
MMRNLSGSLSSAPETQSVRPQPGPIVETRNLSKSFGTTKVLHNLSLSIHVGESRALVGRNGAGKSTLVAALTGVIAPDDGEIRFSGEPAPRIDDRAGWRDRVACVYQRSTLMPELSVAENLFLNSQPGRGNWVSWKRMQRDARDILDDWRVDVDEKAEAGSLSIEHRHIVEIARALRQGARFIIFDEPTAELEGAEVTRLFERINQLRQSDVTFIYISHHLEEIYEVCQTVTVLRDGREVVTAPLSDMPKGRIVQAMVGDAARSIVSRSPRPITKNASEAPALECSKLAGGRILRDLSFHLYPGECVGLTGLLGSGKEFVADALAGLLRPTSGRLLIAGREVAFGNVSRTQRSGLSYVPRDRRMRGILPQLSIAENLTVTVSERLGAAGFISPARQEREAETLFRSLEIVAASLAQPLTELSGGNQQKTVVGRALASNPRILVLAHPTQGVDIASKEALFAIVDRALATGAAVLIVSDDLDELAICNRLLVLFKGEMIREFGADWAEEEVVAAIEGLSRNVA